MTDSNETDDDAATPGANRLFGTAMVLIDKMSVSQRRSRVLERWLAISVALDILLSIALVFVFAGQVNLNSSFRVAQQKQNASLSLALIKSCQAGNDNKAHDIELWNDILKTDHPKTAAQELTLLNLQRLVHVRDQPIDCIARYSSIISH
jgi:hypothetical protein